MAATTVEEYAAALAPIMKTASGASTAAITAALIPVLAAFAIGGLSLNRMAALGQKGLQDGDTWRREVADWATGPADGGPDGDGLYPMTTPDGVVNLWPGLAKMQAEHAEAIAELAASGAVLEGDDYNLDAITYASTEEAAQTAMMDWLKGLNDLGVAWPSADRVLMVFDLIKGLVDSGIWSKLQALYLLAQETSAASLLNLKNPAAFPLSASGGPTFTADRGWKGGATNSGARLQTVGAAFPGTPSQNSLSFGGWIVEGPTRGHVIYLGASTRILYSGGALSAQVSGGTSFAFPTGDTAGFFAAARGAAGEARFLHDENPLGSNTGTSSANASAFSLLGLSSSTGQETDALLGAAYVASNLTTAELGVVRRLFGNHFRNLARAV